MTERRREAATGYLFILPSFFGFIVFVLGPLGAALVLSFTRYDLVSRRKFIGLDNFARLGRTRGCCVVRQYGHLRHRGRRC